MYNLKVLYSRPQLQGHPLLKETANSAILRKTQDFSFYFFVKKTPATTQILDYANSLRNNFLPAPVFSSIINPATTLNSYERPGRGTKILKKLQLQKQL